MKGHYRCALFVLLFLAVCSTSRGQSTPVASRLSTTELWVLAQLRAGKQADLRERPSQSDKGSWEFKDTDFVNIELFVDEIRHSNTPVSQYLLKKLARYYPYLQEPTKGPDRFDTDSTPSIQDRKQFASAINHFLAHLNEDLYSMLTTELRIPFGTNADFTPATSIWLQNHPKGDSLRRLNRRIVEELYPNYMARNEISSSFLVGLLSQKLLGVWLSSHSIAINDAIIVGPVTFEDERSPYSVAFSNCRFADHISFKGSEFQNFSLSGSIVHTGHFTLINLSRMHVDGDLDVSNVTFAGDANFSYTEINGEFSANDAQFNAGDGSWQNNETYFELMKVGKDAKIDRATFNGETSFYRSSIGGDFSCKETHFDDKVYFSRMNVDRKLIFDRSVFQGEEAHFDDMQVRGNTSFSNSTFAEGVDFSSTNFGRDFSFSPASYQGKYSNFSHMHVGGDATFTKSALTGEVILTGTMIEQNLGVPIDDEQVKRIKSIRSHLINT